jgi:hypothetical protein
MMGVLVSAGLGMLAGTLGCLWWARRAGRQRRRIPAHWPLDPRRMASSAERLVWRWLDRAFIDHHVMIKVPRDPLHLAARPAEKRLLASTA